jgi:hypothetical protein
VFAITSSAEFGRCSHGKTAALIPHPMTMAQDPSSGQTLARNYCMLDGRPTIQFSTAKQ